ncbi:tetratricopeptide repeat protein [Candidatus Woesearchaeota archaeon]|nr:tetratricopeptide repeat protein [Candidatus Woesearchaeota archaeon]
MPDLSHFLEELTLERGAHVKEDFQFVLKLGVKPVIYGGKHGGPSLFDLAGLDLLPVQRIKFGDVTYYMSRVFEIKSKGEISRPGFVYYLQRISDKGDVEIFVHSAYNSSSENEWRAVSHTSSEKDWIGKGVSNGVFVSSELTTGFPLEITDLVEDAYTIQRGIGLDKIGLDIFLGIPKRHPWGSRTGTNPLEAFEHSMIIMDKSKSRRGDSGTIDPDQTSTTRIRSLPDQIAWFTANDPRSHVFAEGYAPDFDKCFKIKETQNALYGKVTTYYFFSENLELQYCFHIDEENRAWCGAGQVTAPGVTRFGVKKIYLEFGEIIWNMCQNCWMSESDFTERSGPVSMGLFSPAKEYSDRIIPMYRGDRCEKSDHYSDATKFTHQIPKVAEFRQGAVGGSIKVGSIEDILRYHNGSGGHKQEGAPQLIVSPPEEETALFGSEVFGASARRNVDHLFQTHYEQAYALLKSGDFDGAAEHFKKLVGLKPNNTWIHSDYAVVLKKTGDIDSARTYAQKAKELHPGNKDAQELLDSL